jgi:hypothetical protein
MLSVALVLAACGTGAHRSPADTGGTTDETRAAKKAPKAWIAVSDDPEIGDDENPYADIETTGGAVAEARRNAKKAGDFHVFRYSGSFSKRPVTLTEQVITVSDDGTSVTDFVMEDGDKVTALRVEKKKDGEVACVTRRSKDGEEPATIPDFDRMMKRVQFVPDSNDEVVGTEDTTCMVGGDSTPCEVTRYKVTVGKKQAILSVSRSKEHGRDLGGEIVTTSGKVLYTASMIERGNDTPGDKSVALLEHRISPAR